jgi:hypothetical protein
MKGWGGQPPVPFDIHARRIDRVCKTIAGRYAKDSMCEPHKTGESLMFDALTLAGIIVALIVVVVVGRAYRFCPFCGDNR